MNDRLEVIKDYIDLFEEASNRDDINKLYVELLNLYVAGHIDYLYAQAERAGAMDGIGKENIELDNIILEIRRANYLFQKQNKRYREAMKEAREASYCCGLTAGAILSEALEESK